MKILVTADWHIKGERPVCRLDEDWIESQRKTISEIREIFTREKCGQVWILGDLFDAPKCSTAAVNMLLGELQKFPSGSVKVLCGNHDLKDHNFGNLEECSIGTIKHLFGDVPDIVGSDVQWSVSASPFGLDDLETQADVVCTHQLTFPNEEARPMPGCGKLAHELLEAWPSAEIVFTGDYHHAYIYQECSEDTPARFVVTPGCINIQKADELDYQPSVVVWDTNVGGENAFHTFNLDPQVENCTRDHIEARESQDSRLSDVVETIRGGSEVTLDFDSNLEAAVSKCRQDVVSEYESVRQSIGCEA